MVELKSVLYLHPLRAISSVGSEHPDSIGRSRDQIAIKFLTLGIKIKRAISSVGSEHLVYTERVGGSNPSLPTKKPQQFVEVFLFLKSYELLCLHSLFN